MFKSKLTLFGPVFVLVSGLVSCGPKEKKTQDVYRAQAPVIRQGGLSIGFKEWEQVAKKDLDLNDSIDARSARAAATEFTSSCRAGEQNYGRHIQVSGSPELKLFQLLPSEVLPIDLASMKVHCTVKVALTNDVGSKHIIPEIQAMLTDLRGASAALEMDGAVISQALPQFRVSKLGSRRARAADFSGQAQVICEDAASAPLVSQAVVALADFDYQKMHNHSQRQPAVLESKPVQRCRVQFLKDKIAAAMTTPFLLRFESPALQYSVSALHHQGQPISPVSAAQSHTELMRLRVQNPSQGGRTLVLAKGKVGAQASAILDPTGWHFSHPIAYVTAAPIANGHAQVREAQDHFVVQLAGGASFEIAVTIRAPAFTCTPAVVRHGYQPDTPKWIRINTSGEFFVREVSEAGTELGTLALNLQQAFYFGHTREMIDRQPIGHNVSISACSWP